MNNDLESRQTEVLQVLSVEDFSPSEQDTASMDSRVRRNLDKPMRIFTIDHDEEVKKRASDQTKTSTRRFSNCDDVLNYTPSKEDE